MWFSWTDLCRDHFSISKPSDKTSFKGHFIFSSVFFSYFTLYSSFFTLHTSHFTLLYFTLFDINVYMCLWLDKTLFNSGSIISSLLSLLYHFFVDATWKAIVELQNWCYEEKLMEWTSSTLILAIKHHKFSRYEYKYRV